MNEPTSADHAQYAQEYRLNLERAVAQLQKHGFDFPSWSDLPPGWLQVFTDARLARLRECGLLSFGQIKEKFGTLRAYPGEFVSGMSESQYEEAHEILHSMEQESCVLCQDCGKVGSLREERRWLLTLCDECSATRG